MEEILIRNVFVVNEDRISALDVRISGGRIVELASAGSIREMAGEIIDGTGLYLFPGLIDDQVHFREPGLTHKGEIATESAAAVAGGITSFMEMPNTFPPATSVVALEEKYKRAAEVSVANYSFFIGTTNTNIDELKRIDPTEVCGVKIFMGSSTGEMLVDDAVALERIFSEIRVLIAVHCEDDPLIRKNTESMKAVYGEDIPARMHPLIRSEEACYNSSSFAVRLAQKHNTRLHILHISTAKELELFRNDIPPEQKRITAEACVHHLWFTDADYDSKGMLIKWNPAIKTRKDRDAIREAVNNNLIDVIATDHAPHTLEEKSAGYLKAPSGGPLVQHALPALLDLYHEGVFTLEIIARKTAHNVADMFSIDSRGYIREGYHADLVLVDLNKPLTVSKENILYKCGWSPFEGHTFKSSVVRTWVNGVSVYADGKVNNSIRGQRLRFNR